MLPKWGVGHFEYSDNLQKFTNPILKAGFRFVRLLDRCAKTKEHHDIKGVALHNVL